MNKLFCGFPAPSPSDFQWQIQGVGAFGDEAPLLPALGILLSNYTL